MHAAIYKYLRVFPEDVRACCCRCRCRCLIGTQNSMLAVWGSMLSSQGLCITACLPTLCLTSRISPAAHAVAYSPPCCPQHAFILTEPPLNSPENREYTAEIM